MLRDGNNFGMLVGGYALDDSFVPLTLVPGPEFDPARPVYLPMTPDRIVEALTIRMLAGEMTREQVSFALVRLRQGARAKLTQRVRDGLARAERDYTDRLQYVNIEIAGLQAARERLVAGGANPPAGGANPPAGGNVARIGSGVLKDTRIPGSPRVGLFEIKRDGNRSQLTLTFGPELKQIGVEDSVDVANQTATYKFEVTLPVAVKGASKMRGRAKVDFRNNKVRSTFEETFDPAANRWTPADPVINALESDRSLAWGEESPSDRKVLSKRGQLIAAAGKNEAQVSFDLQVRSGAVYTFELKAPATRLVFHVVGADGNTIESKFTKQSLARQIHHSFDEGQSWRVTIAGFGADLPANYELEVREYWQFNGNVPPNSWAR